MQQSLVFCVSVLYLSRSEINVSNPISEHESLSFVHKCKDTWIGHVRPDPIELLLDDIFITFRKQVVYAPLILNELNKRPNI